MAITISGSGITSANIADGTIVNADVADVAASKLTGALPAIDGSALTGMAAGGLYESVAIIVDEKANNVMGGTFTAGAWRTKDLNTKISDADNIVSLASNQFTLQAGTYTLIWLASAYKVNRHRTKIWNVTDSTEVGHSRLGYSSTNVAATSYATGETVVTIPSAKTFSLQHICQTTGHWGNANSNVDGLTEYYSMVTIHKHL